MDVVSENRAIRWGVTGRTRRGAAHIRSDLKNQDSIHFGASEDASAVVLALADGHGSDMSFRSDAGSQMAVDIAINLLKRLAQTGGPGNPASRHARRSCDMLARTLTRAWRDAVRWHLDAKPFTGSERADLIARLGTNRLPVIERDPAIVYGSTLLAVLATQTYLLSVQLGDGVIILVDPGGQSRRAFPADPMGQARRTDSLAQREAAAKVKVQLSDAADGLPALVLVATDGFTDSFSARQEVLTAGRDCLEAIRTGGFGNIDGWLETRLEEAASRGSQDDITVGLIARLVGDLNA